MHHDPAAVLGGIRALFLQSLHPEVMLGFYGVTGTRDDPWGRLARTGSYVNAITYGTEAEAEAAAARVRKVHAALRPRPARTGCCGCTAARSTRGWPGTGVRAVPR